MGGRGRLRAEYAFVFGSLLDEWVEGTQAPADQGDEDGPEQVWGILTSEPPPVTSDFVAGVLGRYETVLRELRDEVQRFATGEALATPDAKQVRAVLKSIGRDRQRRRALRRRANAAAADEVQVNEYAGVLTIEFFVERGRLLANEMAPRVHNSGHWTIEGAATSQFENHLRAILGWPLGETRALGHAAMVNLIGTMPEPERLLALPGVHLHDYGKTPRPDRKLGHCTIVEATARERDRVLKQVERRLRD